VKTGEIILRTSPSNDRLSMQAEGDRLDKKTEGQWVLDELSRKKGTISEDVTIVVDSVRIIEQIKHIRSAYHPVTYVHLTAPFDVLKQRYIRRYNGKSNIPSYEKVKENPTEQNIESLAKIADIVINTNLCEETDISVQAASRMSLYGNNNTGYVDVVVGGQYGSEGKGQIVGFLAKEYDLLIRVGGPNAGHTVFEDPAPYIHHQLPSGTRKCDAQLLLGPGMVINVEKLLKEISECEVEYDRLSIDPQAMTINEEDIIAESGIKERIGSTAQGVGEATARRIKDRGLETVKLAKDIPELNPFIRPAIDILTRTFANNGRVLLEGTQGEGLSIYHGKYPFVTSRDTTVSGCLAEAGIAPSRVRRVVMVCRTNPIRVENPKYGDSGPMKGEITLEEISRRSGIPVPVLEEREKTSTTYRNRRIAEFDWELLREASFINGATDIALTFTDYLSPNNSLARRFDQLTLETINFIEDIEHVSKAKVSLITTGFDSRSVIDRREW
jgi:adenylosuccinate synthase